MKIMGAPELKFITEAAYLEAERVALDKHEYFKGEIFAMSGASLAHNEISINCVFELKNKLKGKPCQPYGSDLRVHIPLNSLFTYPDISIYCGEVETIDDKFDTATNPSVIIEILSPSTRNYDLGQKFALYREIETLKEYILIDSEKVNVLKYSKNDDDSWLLVEYKSMDDFITINVAGIEIQVKDIYENVKFINN